MICKYGHTIPGYVLRYLTDDEIGKLIEDFHAKTSEKYKFTVDSHLVKVTFRVEGYYEYIKRNTKTS